MTMTRKMTFGMIGIALTGGLMIGFSAGTANGVNRERAAQELKAKLPVAEQRLGTKELAELKAENADLKRKQSVLEQQCGISVDGALQRQDMKARLDMD
ncbi:MAG: hypothetical protein WCT31_04380 [Candidatus Micrarchaeia archaeon]